VDGLNNKASGDVRTHGWRAVVQHLHTGVKVRFIVINDQALAASVSER
jgi:hypothetical protein